MQAPPQAPATAAAPSQTPAATGRSTFLAPHIAQSIQSGATITAGLSAASPDTAVSSVAKKLYGHQIKYLDVHSEEPSKVDKFLDKLHLGKSNVDKGRAASAVDDYKHDQTRDADSWQTDRMSPLSQAQLAEVMAAGQWGGTQPSELFLNIYGQALLTLDKDLLNGMVSPALMGSTGVVPLTVISVIPDIVHHMAVLLTQAQHEIFLATNYWEASGAAKVLTDAMRELSRRVVERKGNPIVIKLMYDRGNPKQMVQPHQTVDAKIYTDKAVKLPAPEDVPGLLLEVQNYHVPPVGTFHAKYMVVDRKVAILQSNNIQDRVNMEMMVHIEGPIVQSFYDMALLSWWHAMSPPLPLLMAAPTYSVPGNAAQYQFGKDHPIAAAHGDLNQASNNAAATLSAQNKATERRHHSKDDIAEPVRDPVKSRTNDDRIWDATSEAEAQRVNASASGDLTTHLNTGTPVAATYTASLNSAPFRPIVLLPPHDPVPMAMVNRAPRGRPGHGDTVVPQDQAWLAGFKFARKEVFIQTPTFNAKPVVAGALDAVRRGVLVIIYADLGFNDEGELLPFQGGTNEMVAQHMYAALEPPERDLLRIHWYTGKDQATPLNATKKSRNCHVKLMIVDGQIAIQGNGNQDSQSWYHSQEINILIDSPLICEQWRTAIDTNQNTKTHGRVQNDGIWRDPQGQVLPGTKPPPNPLVRPFVGVKGAVQRVRGEGGFAT